MADNGEKLIFIPHKLLLNSNKQHHSTPPPNLSSILRFLLMNTEKANQGETRKVRKLRFNESVDAV